MKFASITNPIDFNLGQGEVVDEAVGIGAKSDPGDPAVKDEPDKLSDIDDEKIEKSSATLVNKYDPNKVKFNENGERVVEPVKISETYNKVIWETMDCSDTHTLDVVMAMNEAEQNSLLVNLTNKLYQMIVNKVDSIDYGEIPGTKGDVRKLSKYDQLCECHEVLKDIFKQYHENDIEPILTVQRGLDNLENMRDIFMGAYLAKSSFPITVYQTTTLAVINATSLLIACCIDYVKNPKAEGLTVVLNKVGVAKAKDHLLFDTLSHFNEACRKGDMENALRPFVKNRVRGFAITAAIGFKTILVLGAVLIAILPFIKDLVYFYYATKARVSEYFDLQAKFLEMNAAELKDSDIKTEGDKASVIRKQLAIASTFHNIANALQVDAKSSEVKATKEIKQDSKKYKIDDIDTNADTAGGSLF